MGASAEAESSKATSNANNNNSMRDSDSSRRGSAVPYDEARQNRKVCLMRVVLISTLITAAVVVATFIGLYVGADERENFETQYEDSVAKLTVSFQNRFDTKHLVAETLSAIITSRYGNVAQDAAGKSPIWPNMTMPDFQEQSEGLLKMAEGRALSFNPIITQDVNRLEWEAHAAESAWIIGDEGLVTPPPDATWPANRTVSFGIYSRDENRNVVYDPGNETESKYPSVMVPVWQIAPIKTNEKAVMFNLHSEPNRMNALDHMLEYKVPAVTAILQLVQDTEMRPSSILFAPVFDNPREGHEGKARIVVGSVSVVFSWDVLLNNILPDYIKGMICVLRASTTGQTVSYTISGDIVTLIGEGDHHDVKYEKYGRTVKASEEFIVFSLSMYPSAEFEAQYVTNSAGIYAAGAVLIFFFTSALFLLYDYLMENRQQRTAQMARQAGNVIDNLFPVAFRERLFKIHNNNDEQAHRRSTNSGVATRRGSAGSSSAPSLLESESGMDLTPTHPGVDDSYSTRPSIIQKSASVFTRYKKSGLKNAITQINGNNPSFANSGGRGGLFDDDPIVEMFEETSILFSDIVEFTKWSSERSPTEVFQLLEQIFWEFDEIAARYKIFKLGTIGDCYIGVTGLPDPAQNHATLLSQFAFEARDKAREVCARLDGDGLNTAKLDMRFGIHSGDITAGILRGTKSRFELFGDTINTASRMESTSQPGKIQVSEETAKLLRGDGKSHWLCKRPDVQSVKGKGMMQTYWLEPRKSGYRVSFSGNLGPIPNIFATPDDPEPGDANEHECNNKQRREEKVEEVDEEQDKSTEFLA